LFINRELSWLAFNERVLAQALDRRTPLLERLKFLAIFSTNLDEYFMIRVAGIKKQIASGVTPRTPDGLSPEEQFQAINERLKPLLAKLQEVYQALLPELAAQGIVISNYADLEESDRLYAQTYFKERVFPVLTPLAVGPSSHPFPHLSNLSLNLGVILKGENNSEHFARIKVPHQLLQRFVALTKPYHFIPIEQIVAAHLDLLFPGLEVKGAYAFRVTRNADIEIQEDEAEDLLLTIKQELSRRRFGEVVRLEVDPLMPDSLLKDQLLDFLELSEDFVYPVPGLLDLSSLWGLVGLDFPHLKDAPFQPRPHERLGEGVNIFEEIQRGDILLHHPYQSFTSSVEYFIRSAMADPQVLAIKQTLYRTGGDSALIQALMAAAENGKQVAVLVELKARFDEANNITWAEALEKAGVHVVYGLLGLKTHAKVALVVRQEAEGLRRYIHIGTGNYNAKTARIYTDMGLLTCDPEVGADATDLFNYLTGYSLFKTYRKLLVAPLTLRESLVQLIQREMNLHCPERPGQIMIKLNSLVDPELIQLLYQASERGVEIDLIIRGICCLRPGVAGVSENIRVISIIGRFLEHSRVLYLHNGGNEEVYIGSADWMTRNLDKRVEVMVPVADAQLKQKVIKVLRDSMRDNRQSWLLQEDGSYQARQPLDGEEEFSLQANLLL